MSHKRLVEIEDIPCEITKRKMKNMYIRIDKETGNAKVSVPYRVSYDDATRFIIKNIEWVRKNREQMLEKISARPSEYTTGEMITLWGEDFPIKYIPTAGDRGVILKEGEVIIYAPVSTDYAGRRKLVEEWYRSKLDREIKLLIPECCEITGKEPKQWRIRDMKTKWGTCNYRDERIWLNLQLVTKPRECLRYVMLHELTHLYVHNHGPEFRAYMDKFCPNWREIKKILNEQER